MKENCLDERTNIIHKDKQMIERVILKRMK